MTHALTIALAPDGRVRLHFNELNFVDIAPTEAGMRALVAILQDHTNISKIGTPGFPTQWAINEELKRQITKKELEMAIEVDIEGML